MEMHGVGLAGMIEEPQHARRRHAQAQRVGPDETLELPTLIMAQSIEGVGVETLDFNGPAVSILLQHVLYTAGQLRGVEGRD